MTKVLITGASGFVGNHLAFACKEKGWSVHGIGHAELSNDSPLKNNLENYKKIDLINSEECDTLDFSDISVVFHLAGLAAVGPSFDQPLRYINDNSAMLINISEKTLRQNMKPRFIVISSGSVYDPTQELPINEAGKLLSNSPYSVSKITTELLCDYYRQRGLDMVVVRPFNHIGPGQSLGFILPDLVNQANEYSKTRKFRVGNLKTKRDYTDVRDVANAYVNLAAADKLNSTVYNVCTGQTYSGEFILDEICKNYSISDPVVEIDQSKVRPSDIMDICGDNSRIKKDSNWAPEIPIEQSIKDFIHV